MRTPTFVRLLPILILLATLSGSPAAVRGQDGSTDSAMFLFDPAHSGAWPGPGPTGKLAVRWQTTLAVPNPRSNAETTSPVVAGGSVYIAVAHDVVALDATTGAIRWRFTTQDGTENSTPAVAGGVVFAGSFDGHVYALDAATGQEIWRTEVGPMFVALTVADGTVYAGSADHNLYALDAATGSVRWIAPTPWHFRGAPAVADGSVYVCTEDGDFYAFDAATGAERWHRQIGQLVFAAPVVAAGVVYAIDAFGDTLYALDEVTGQERWHFDGGNLLAESSPLVVGDTVYLINGDVDLFAIDAETGTERWRMLVPKDATAPIIAGGVIYFLEGISLCAVDLAARKVVSEILVPRSGYGALLTSPAIAYGMVYAATRAGVAVAFAGDGTPPPST
jgi:outer membrane protein assembly factor BamB